MILSTPRLNIISVFDVFDGEHSFSFSYIGNQTVKNRLVVKDNLTFEEVYNKEQTTMSLEHIINTEDISCLKNNQSYIAQIQVYDVNGNSRNLSDPVLFTCHEKPSFSFLDIDNETTISSENLTLNLLFSQSEGDKISDVIYELYDHNQILQTISETYHNITAYTFYGLKNRESYYVRAIGKTVFGFSIDTGFKKINVMAKTKSSNINFMAENDNGKILFSTNLIVTDCKTENDNYSFEDGKVNLRDNAVIYTIKDIENFSIVIVACEMPLDMFAAVNCKNGDIELVALEIGNRYYCKLRAKNNSGDYYVLYKEITDFVSKNNSNRLEKKDANKDLILEAHRKDGLCSLSVKYKEVGSYVLRT